MSRPKMTEEQKLQRKLEKKVEKQAQREAEWKARQEVWAKKAEESRETILSGMEDNYRKTVVSCLEFAAKSNNDFLKDLSHKWRQFGALSTRQIEVLVSSVERDRRKEVIAEVIEEWYVVGEKSEINKLKVCKVEEVSSGDRYFDGVITKISMKNKAGIFFSVKTNTSKLVDAFKEALEKGLTVNLNAKVKWHFEDSDTVILTSRGMKIKIENNEN